MSTEDEAYDDQGRFPHVAPPPPSRPLYHGRVKQPSTFALLARVEALEGEMREKAAQLDELTERLDALSAASRM